MVITKDILTEKQEGYRLTCNINSYPSPIYFEILNCETKTLTVYLDSPKLEYSPYRYHKSLKVFIFA